MKSLIDSKRGSGMGPYKGAKSRTSPGSAKGFQGGPAAAVAKDSRSRPLDGAKNIAWK